MLVLETLFFVMSVVILSVLFDVVYNIVTGK